MNKQVTTDEALAQYDRIVAGSSRQKSLQIFSPLIATEIKRARQWMLLRCDTDPMNDTERSALQALFREWTTLGINFALVAIGGYENQGEPNQHGILAWIKRSFDTGGVFFDAGATSHRPLIHCAGSDFNHHVGLGSAEPARFSESTTALKALFPEVKQPKVFPRFAANSIDGIGRHTDGETVFFDPA